MTLDEIRALGLRFAELCEKYGIAELSVFGSVARGDARPDSDVDLLYVRVPGNDLGMSYFALREDLEKLFGRPVDLVPKDGLHRVIRDQVLADAQVLYAAWHVPMNQDRSRTRRPARGRQQYRTLGNEPGWTT